MTENIIRRIEKMEEHFVLLQQVLKSNPQRLKQDDVIQNCLAELSQYYQKGQWLADYEADEQGKLPQELKRGVLSQDGVYNLLKEIENVQRIEG